MARSTTFKYAVTVVSSGGNKYAIDGNTQQYVILFPGCTYEFNQDDSSNATHPLRFSETSDGTHNSGSEYTTGITTSGTPGSATAFTKIEVTSDTPVTLYYYCSSHSGMGGLVNVPSSLSGNRGYILGGAVGGAPGPGTNTIQSIIINTLGNASDFGDLTTADHRSGFGSSNSIKSIVAGGGNPSNINVISSMINNSLGSAADFGDLATATRRGSAISNDTRCVFGGGVTPGHTNVISYVTIAQQSDATDFGDLTTATADMAGGLNSTTRGVFAGGATPSQVNTIQYITTASTGNATDFGDLTVVRQFCAGVSSSTRGVTSGGNSSPTTPSDVMDYITIASTGNATDFGDMTTLFDDSGVMGVSNSLRGVFTGICAPSNGTRSNIMEYITISTTGDTLDFGDLTVATNFGMASSDGHGGLS